MHIGSSVYLTSTKHVHSRLEDEQDLCSHGDHDLRGIQVDESTYNNMLHTIKVHQKLEGITKNNRLGWGRVRKGLSSVSKEVAGGGHLGKVSLVKKDFLTKHWWRFTEENHNRTQNPSLLHQTTSALKGLYKWKGLKISQVLSFEEQNNTFSTLRIMKKQPKHSK